jgi:hypothetical protein
MTPIHLRAADWNQVGTQQTAALVAVTRDHHQSNVRDEFLGVRWLMQGEEAVFDSMNRLPACVCANSSKS